MSESDPPSQPDEILMDLLIKQVTEGLSPAEQRELGRLGQPGCERLRERFRAGGCRDRIGRQCRRGIAAAAAARTPRGAGPGVFCLRRLRVLDGRGRCGRGGNAAAARGVGPADKVVGLRTPTPSAARRSTCCRATARRAQRRCRMVGCRRLSAARGVRLAALAAPDRGSRGGHAAADRAAGRAAGAGPCTTADARRGARRAACPARLAQDHLGRNQGPGSRGHVRRRRVEPRDAAGILALRRAAAQRPADAPISAVDFRRHARSALSGGRRRVRCAGGPGRGGGADPRRAAGSARRKPLPSPSRSRAAWWFQGVSTSWHSGRQVERLIGRAASQCHPQAMASLRSFGDGGVH